ncbi:MAG: hypothetical protein NT051_06575, partial [Candidatus Micrarchaeota archaeon]|nr:hypothetical protein [Candidatus Micrarchaeota archaeon]
MAPPHCPSRAQGATEYLVLLAVVLVIALVGIALLGFFPGTAGDTIYAQNKIYWKGVTPLAITDRGQAYTDITNDPGFYFFDIVVTNTGSYPISIDGIIGKEGLDYDQSHSRPGASDVTVYLPDDFLSSYMYAQFNATIIQPGETLCIGYNSELQSSGWGARLPGSACDKTIAYNNMPASGAGAVFYTTGSCPLDIEGLPNGIGEF